MGDIPPRRWGVSTRRRRLCRCETRHHGRDLKGWRIKCWDRWDVKTWFGPCLFGPCRPRFSKIGPWTSGFGAEFWSPSSRKTMGVWTYVASSCWRCILSVARHASHSFYTIYLYPVIGYLSKLIDFTWYYQFTMASPLAFSIVDLRSSIVDVL